MAETEEKVFHHFLEFSQRVRMIVIDEMKPADRCRLTRCSKMCNKEAKASKNYIYGLKIFYYIPYGYDIELIYGNKESRRNDGTRRNNGYILEFSGRSERKYKKYLNRSHQTFWETELDSGTNVAQLALEELKNIFQSYQKTIRQLKISISSSEGSTKKRGFIDFGIESLDSLEHLTIERDVDTLNILSKLRKPLKTLHIDQYENKDIILHKAIYQVQEKFTWLRAKFENQQFLQLSAKNVEISIENLTERDLFNFIRSWQNGSIGKNIESYCWGILRSNFSTRKLLKLLRHSDHNDERERLEIKHFEDAGKIAKLYIDNYRMVFSVQRVRH